MSSGKTLKIIDTGLVSLRESAASQLNNSGSIDDPVRFAAKKYYHNFLIRKSVNNEQTTRASNRLIYGNDPSSNNRAQDDSKSGRLRYSNSMIEEIHFSETTERCTPRIYEKVQSVRIVGNASLIRNDNHWTTFINGGTVSGSIPETTDDTELSKFGGKASREERPTAAKNSMHLEDQEGTAQADYASANTKYQKIVHLNKVYYDHCTSLALPFSKKEAELLYGNVGSVYGNVDYVYNFLQEDYETVIAQKSVSEQILPNIYALMSAFDEDSNIGMSRDIKKHVTLEGSLPLSVYKKLKMSKFSGNGSSRESAAANGTPPGGMKMEYFRDWSLIGVEKYLNRPISNLNIGTRFANILVPEKNINLINEYNVSKEMFPMFADISFSTDTSTEIAQAFSDLNLNCSLMKGMYQLLTQQTNINTTAGAETGGVEVSEEDATDYGSGRDGRSPGLMSLYSRSFITQTDIPQSARGSTACDPKIVINSEIKTEQYRMMDLNEWIEYFHASLSGPFKNSGVFFGNRQRGMDLSQNPTTEYEKNFLMTVLRSKVQTIVQNNMRSYDDIIDGDMAYSETIMYRIAKFKGSSNIPIQNYWVSNSNKIDMLNFVDTQIKYNKEYRYVVYAYQVVLGTRYAYKNLAISKTLTEDPVVCIEMFDASTGEAVPERVPFTTTRHPITKLTKMTPVKKEHRFIAEFDAVVRPSVKIVEIPYMQFSARLVDSPPMPPDINITPYLNINNKINIFMNNGVGKITTRPIMIDTALESRQIRRYRRSKGLEPSEDITFESDDRPSSFLIYKTDVKPSSYGSFRGKLHKRINVSNITAQNPNLKEDIKGAFSSIAADDKLSPNKKYYYTFKSIDYHGNISNPSPVYEVEIVSENGSSFFLMDTVSFDIQEPRQPTITGKRLLQIAPNISQRLINEEQSKFDEATSANEIRNKVILGLNDVGVWDKRYKFRLTSTKTGKKIDLNIKFVPQRKKTKSDFE